MDDWKEELRKFLAKPPHVRWRNPALNNMATDMWVDAILKLGEPTEEDIARLLAELKEQE